MARKKYTYIPLEEIDYIETVNGKTIEGSELLDGAYARGRKKYSHGGEIEYLTDEQVEKMLTDVGYEVDEDDFSEIAINEGFKWSEKYNMWYRTDHFAKGGYMAKGGELATYKIVEKFKYDLQPKWQDEKFQTGGREFLTYKQAQDFKNKLQAMTSSIEYKVVKLPKTKIDQSKIYYFYKGGKFPLMSEKDIFFDKVYSDKEVLELLDEDYSGKLSKEQFEMIENAGFEYDDDKEGWVAIKSFGSSPYGDDDEYGKGGKLRKHRRRKKSLEERAEELVGSQEWHMLDRAEKADVISEMVTEGILPVFAKGGVADAQSYKVKFTLSNSEIVEVDYSSKEDMDNGIADFYLANDVENVEVIEKEEKKKGLFDMAKKAPAKKSASKEKPEVIVEGIESDIARYDELKEIINNAKAEQEIIGGKLKAIGTEEFLNMYEEDKRKPENFNLADGDEKILFIVMDKYKKVEPEKAAILRKYKGLLEEVTTYSFNPEVLDRVGDVVSNLIMNSDELSDEDKKRLLIVDTTVAVKKGSIDRLMDYDNPEEIYALIEPIVALK